MTYTKTMRHAHDVPPPVQPPESKKIGHLNFDTVKNMLQDDEELGRYAISEWDAVKELLIYFFLDLDLKQLDESQIEELKTNGAIPTESILSLNLKDGTKNALIRWSKEGIWSVDPAN